jgi:hypothetical protein
VNQELKIELNAANKRKYFANLCVHSRCDWLH